MDERKAPGLLTHPSLANSSGCAYIQPVKLLDRYITSRFWRFFAVAVAAFVVVFLVVDIVENLDHYIDKKARAVDVVIYYLYYLPYIIVLVTPVGTLLAASFLAGYLVKHREIVALKSAGIPSLRVAATLILWGAAISVGVFFCGEVVIPRTNTAKDELRQSRIDKRRRGRRRFINELFYIAQDGAVYYFRMFDTKKGVGRDVVIHRFSDGRLVERTDARLMTWQGTFWRLCDVAVRRFTEGGETLERYRELDLRIPDTPQDFARKAPKPEEMSFWELRRFIQKVRRSGIEPKREQTDLWMKLAYPLVNLIVLMLGFPLSLRSSRGSYIYGFGQSFFVAFIYLGALRTGQALGYNGTLPPALAAFAGDIVFFALGVLVLWLYRD